MSVNVTEALSFTAVTLPRTSAASIAPKLVFNIAPPRIDRTTIFPFEFSTSTPAASVISTAPKLVRTCTVSPVRTPLTAELFPVHDTRLRTSENRIPPKEPVSSAFPCTLDASIEPLFVLTERSPSTFFAVTEPNEEVTSAGPPEPSSCTLPLLLEIRLRPFNRETETVPKRLTRSSSPVKSATVTLPLLFTIVALPSLRVRSTFPKEFSSRCGPRPSRTTIDPLEFFTSTAAFDPEISTSPNLLRASSCAPSGMTMS